MAQPKWIEDSAAHCLIREAIANLQCAMNSAQEHTLAWMNDAMQNLRDAMDLMAEDEDDEAEED